MVHSSLNNCLTTVTAPSIQKVSVGVRGTYQTLAYPPWPRTLPTLSKRTLLFPGLQLPGTRIEVLAYNAAAHTSSLRQAAPMKSSFHTAFQTNIFRRLPSRKTALPPHPTTSRIHVPHTRMHTHRMMYYNSTNQQQCMAYTNTGTFFNLILNFG